MGAHEKFWSKNPKPLNFKERGKLIREIEDHFIYDYEPLQEFSDKFKLKLIKLALSVS